MPGVSIYIIAWPPHLLGQVVLHNSQQQSHPWFYLLLSSPCIKISLSWSQEPQSSPMTLRRGNSKAAPRWEDGVALSRVCMAELGLPGLPAQFQGPAWEPRALQQLQLSHRHRQGKPLSHTILLLLWHKVLPVRKCHFCCPIAQDFSCSSTETFVFFFRM